MKRAWVLVLAAMAVFGYGQTASARQKAIDVAFYNQTTDQVNFWLDDGDMPRMVQLLMIMNAVYPHDEEVATNLGYILMSTERYEELLVVFKRYRSDNPNDPNAPLPEAQFYLQKKMYNKIPPILEPVINRRPHENVFRVLGNAYKRMGLFKDAARVWEKMLTVYPNDERAKIQLKEAKAQLKGN